MFQSNDNYTEFSCTFWTRKETNYREACEKYLAMLKGSAKDFEEHLSDPEWMKDKTVGEVKIYV